MRYLEGKEKEEAEHWIKFAAEQARDSRCSKSNRGVVIVKDRFLIGKGTNNPPGNLECATERCYPICNEYTIHAEQNAITDAMRNGDYQRLEGSRMYHVKARLGYIENSGGPSCVQCSKQVLESKIGDFVLKPREGYGLYEAGEFHELSLQTLEAKKAIVIPRPMRVITGDQEKVQPMIDKLFLEITGYVKRKEQAENHDFDIDTRMMARPTPGEILAQASDDMITTLKFRDTVVGAVTETRDEFNYVRYSFFVNLDHL
ncbi:MAG: hypothetical protein AABW52_03870 [Nanoarchaeota archaeon]